MEKVSNNKLSFLNNEKFILLIFSIYLIASVLDNTILRYNDVGSLIFKITRYGCYFIFLLNIIYRFLNGEKITLFEFFTFLLAILTLIFSKNTALLLVFIVILSMKNFTFENIVKRTFKVNLIMFILIILFCCMKIFPDWTYARNSFYVRHSLGFYYPTIASTYFFFIILMRIYIKKGNLSFFEIIFEGLTSVILYLYTDSKTGLILISLVLCIVLFKKIFKFPSLKKIENFICKISYLIPIFILLLSFLLVFLYSKNIAQVRQLDSMLSGRLYYSNNAINNYGITAFGEKINWNGWGGFGYGYEIPQDFKYNFVDISYFSIMFDYGIITIFTIILMIMLTLKKAYKSKNKWLIFAVIFSLIEAFVEPNLLVIDKNIFILSIGICFDLKRKYRNEGEK